MELALRVVGLSASLVLGTVTTVYFAPRSVKRKLLQATMLKEGDPELDTSRKYEALPHGKLQSLARNVWTVSGTLPQPGPGFNRNMTVWRVPDSSDLVIHSPICLDKETRAALEDLGTVACVIVPNMHHRLDEHAYREAYPEASFVCPANMAKKVTSCKTNFTVTAEEAASKFGFQALEPDAQIDFDELVYLFPVEKSAAGRQVAVFNDLLWNIKEEKADFVSSLVGSATGHLGMTAIGRIMCPDLAHLRRWIEANFVKNESVRLEAIVVAHGDVVTADEIPAQLAKAMQSMTTVVDA
ncbi:Hypothetical Protein FCC1311_105782 [Hondaea fermentalgiana]|uniref:Uncharacterized protein n=1 Tax=Hondaea fermentalgiana TaxID=2315210 RepID=A0A2R5GUW5_9STRA|nr:Hypothetical Protein FCC1311_105782 [Hondaea fermentalgiana]|eukprot:GBG34355.1 Hypothetical Protein FCC1311_105782 [Hondaea fermentalgiana]